MGKRKYSHQDIAEMRRLYNDEGKRLLEIAEMFNTSFSYVCNLIHHDPYSKRRPHRESPQTVTRELTDKERRRIVSMAEVMHPSQVALRTRRSTQTVRDVIRQHHAR